MQISTSRFYDTAGSLMQQLSQKADMLNTQISTGKKLSSASDDVVAYQRLATMRQASSDATAYGANIATAQSLLQQADGVVDSAQNALQRASELTVQANDGALSADQKKSIATELRSIVDELVSLANTKDTRGQPLFAAATGDSAVTRAADGTVSFAGSGDPASIPIGDGVEIQPGESAQRVFGGVATAAGTTDMFAVLRTYADALDAGGSPAAASAASDGINAALSQLSAVRGSLGARASRLDLEASNATTVATAREADRSALEDTDVTAAITELQKTMTTLQATQASFTKLTSLSLFDYLR